MSQNYTAWVRIIEVKLRFKKQHFRKLWPVPQRNASRTSEAECQRWASSVLFWWNLELIASNPRSGTCVRRWDTAAHFRAEYTTRRCTKSEWGCTLNHSPVRRPPTRCGGRLGLPWTLKSAFDGTLGFLRSERRRGREFRVRRRPQLRCSFSVCRKSPAIYLRFLWSCSSEMAWARRSL